VITACHCGVQYGLPDEWWNEAGMTGFAPARRSFRVAPPERAGMSLSDVIDVPIADVAPVDRRLAYGVFAGPDRVIQILRGFRDDAPIPPVELVRTTAGPHSFRLYAGAHRFCCAVVAGFRAVPAVDVTEPQVHDVDFDEWMRAQGAAPRR